MLIMTKPLLAILLLLPLSVSAGELDGKALDRQVWGAAGSLCLWVVSAVRASACERGFEIPIGALQYM